MKLLRPIFSFVLFRIRFAYTFKTSETIIYTSLTPKGPLSLQGTNGISGKYLRSQFLSWFFETFFEDRKIDYLCGDIIFFPIDAWEQKLCPNKLKARENRQQKKIQNFELFF